jgi:5'-nucleotidase
MSGRFAMPADIAQARILISNDDGIAAPGLAVLREIALQLSSDVWVVAPETEQSGASHSLTMHRPLRIRKLDERNFAVDGTPTDCVLLAINEIMKDHRPTLVLSGVNRGVNTGEDVTYSGTVAAAMEGTLLDVPSIALSQFIDESENPPWETPRRFAPGIITRLVAASWPRNTLINVNFPDRAPDAVTGIKVCALGRRKLGNGFVRNLDPRGRPYYWLGNGREEDATAVDSDIAIVRAGGISVTPVHLDLTHHAAMADLGAVFA